MIYARDNKSDAIKSGKLSNLRKAVFQTYLLTYEQKLNFQLFFSFSSKEGRDKKLFHPVFFPYLLSQEDSIEPVSLS